jgi:hypothetical protein
VLGGTTVAAALFAVKSIRALRAGRWALGVLMLGGGAPRPRSGLPGHVAEQPPDPVPLENRIWLLACGQPAQYGFSMDPLDIEIDCPDARNFALTAGNPLGDALMRPGRVVVHLVLDQDRAQVRLTEDQHAVEELAAQGTEEAFADRVHPGSLDSGLQDPGAGCLEDGVEGLGEV